MSSVTTSTTTCSSSAIRGTREDSTNAPPFSTIMRERRRTSGSSGLPWPEDVGGLTGRGRTGVGDGLTVFYRVPADEFPLLQHVSLPCPRRNVPREPSRSARCNHACQPIQEFSGTSAMSPYPEPAQQFAQWTFVHRVRGYTSMPSEAPHRIGTHRCPRVSSR